MRGLERCDVGLARADSHGAFETEDEDFAVADLPGFGGRGDGVDGLLDLLGCDRHLDFDFWQEAPGLFGAAVDFGVALLAPVSLDLGHGHPVHADRGQSVADLVELERLDDGHDDFHGLIPTWAQPAELQAGQNNEFARAKAARTGAPGRAYQAPCQFSWSGLSCCLGTSFWNQAEAGRGL